MWFLCSFVFGDLVSGNASSLDEQVGRCLQARELQASAAPPSRICARETFGGRAVVPPPPSISTAPQTQLFMNMDSRQGSLASLTCHKPI